MGRSDQWAAAPLQRAANQWVAWGSRFHSNHFETISDHTSVMESFLCLPSLHGVGACVRLGGGWRDRKKFFTPEARTLPPSHPLGWTSFCPYSRQFLETNIMVSFNEMHGYYYEFQDTGTVYYCITADQMQTSGFKTSGFKTSGFKTSGLQNVRFTNVRFQNVWFQNVQFLNLIYL